MTKMPLLFRILYSLVPEIEICTKYFSDKISQKQPQCPSMLKMKFDHIFCCNKCMKIKKLIYLTNHFYSNVNLCTLSYLAWTGATKHSDLECLGTFVNSKMTKFQIFNFCHLQVVVYILYFDKSIQKICFFNLMTIFGKHEVTSF